MIPKVFAMRNSIRFAQKAYFPLRLIFIFFKPIIFVFDKLVSLFNNLIGVKNEKIFDSEEELKILTELGEEQGTLEEEESEMIQSIMEFNNKEAGEIVTPRVDIVGIEASASLDEVMDLISKKQFSKIPVFIDTIDNIQGILHIKDVTPYLTGSRPNINLLSISRSPYFVPENKFIDELLNDFKQKKTNIAIVVDEWGGTEGLITLEDIVEEVMGELSDPYDSEEYSFRKIKDNNFIVEGSIKIYVLEENIDVEFPDIREYDTLAGFILDKVGNIPKVGEVVDYENFSFKVIKIKKNRIDKVEIREEK